MSDLIRKLLISSEFSISPPALQCTATMLQYKNSNCSVETLCNLEEMTTFIIKCTAVKSKNETVSEAFQILYLPYRVPKLDSVSTAATE